MLINVWQHSTNIGLRWPYFGHFWPMPTSIWPHMVNCCLHLPTSLNFGQRWQTFGPTRPTLAEIGPNRRSRSNISTTSVQIFGAFSATAEPAGGDFRNVWRAIVRHFGVTYPLCHARSLQGRHRHHDTRRMCVPECLWFCTRCCRLEGSRSGGRAGRKKRLSAPAELAGSTPGRGCAAIAVPRRGRGSDAAETRAPKTRHPHHIRLGDWRHSRHVFFYEGLTPFSLSEHGLGLQDTTVHEMGAESVPCRPNTVMRRIAKYTYGPSSPAAQQRGQESCARPWGSHRGTTP